ncbi:MAG: RsmE family RNA methyltransferase [Agriterribacter sp.]
MALPFFFIDQVGSNGQEIALDESTSKHIVQVLRMKTGERLHLTDGKGNLFLAGIEQQQKKKCIVRIVEHTNTPASAIRSVIAVSLVKNTARFEWFLEKATELGITAVIPLICERTERVHFRIDRMRNIMISALLQSQQTWLPAISEPLRFQDWVTLQEDTQKYIAHCIEGSKQSLKEIMSDSKDTAVCIGPEGDFTPQEIEQSIRSGFVPVSLGETRLRTETAALVAATLLRIK